MTFGLRGELGLSVLSLVLTTAVGCDDGTTEGSTGQGGTGVKPVTGGTSSTGATGGTSAAGAAGGTTGAGAAGGTTGTTGGTGGAGGTGPVAEGVPLTPDTGGWVDGAGNTLGIQGAMFAYADDTTKASMMGTCPTEGCETPFTVNAGPPVAVCIQGEAAKVDMNCTPVAPATDCYGTFWGAAIGLNLNQPIDPATEMGADPMPFDAATAGIKGFAFNITGDSVPTSLRFKVEDATGEYCTASATPVMVGANTFTFDQLVTECWTTGGTPSTGNGLLKIAWQVVTNASSTVPFNFCVSDVRAVMQ
jgi:hypothetical protein